jgi:hypothetical protein
LEILNEAQALLKDVRRIDKGFQVIPDVVQRRAMKHMIKKDEYQIEKIFMRIFVDIDSSAHNEGLNEDEVFDEAIKIKMAAMDCRNDDVAKSE